MSFCVVFCQSSGVHTPGPESPPAAPGSPTIAIRTNLGIDGGPHRPEASTPRHTHEPRDRRVAGCAGVWGGPSRTTSPPQCLQPTATIRHQPSFFAPGFRTVDPANYLPYLTLVHSFPPEAEYAILATLTTNMLAFVAVFLPSRDQRCPGLVVCWRADGCRVPALMGGRRNLSNPRVATSLGPIEAWRKIIHPSLRLPVLKVPGDYMNPEP